MDCETLAIIRAIIPLVQRVRDYDEEEEQQWPEGYCAEVSALISESIDGIMAGYKSQCGTVKNACAKSGTYNHIWTKIGNLNIDFTGHQFVSLEPHAVDVDGFQVISGTDEYMESLGYVFHTEGQCSSALAEAGIMNLMNGLVD